MSRLTKKQIKENQQVEAWVKGEPFAYYAKDKPTIPELTIEEVIEKFTPLEITWGAKFYTPLDMAGELLSYAPIGHGVTVLEPCVGIGSLVYQMLDMGVDESDITAYDLDTKAIELAEKLFPGVNFINDTPLDHADQLTSKFDIVVMNPPFNCTWGTNGGIEMAEGRCKKSEHLFLELAIRAVKPEGVIVAIAPYNYIERMPKKLKAWADQFVTDFQDMGELPGDFKKTGMKVHGWMIYRNDEPIEIEIDVPEKGENHSKGHSEQYRGKDMGEPVEMQENEDMAPESKEKTEEPAETLFSMDMATLLYEGRETLSNIRSNFHKDQIFTKQPDQELIDDIAELGVLHSILIEDRNGQYIIRAGNRRFLASEQLGLPDIPVIIKRFPLGMGPKASLSSNLKRSDNPVDNYNALLQFEAEMAERGETITDKRTAEWLGIKVSTLRKLRCVETMPEPVQIGINEKRITIDNSYKLAKLPPSKQEPLVRKLEEGGRVTEADIKDQRRVVQDTVKAKTLPNLTVPSNGRSDIPQKKFIRQAVENLHWNPDEESMHDVIADFVYDMMVNPTETLERILKA